MYEQLDCDLVVPSKWLKDLVSRSALKDLRVTLIPNGIDTDVFVKPEYNVLRERYGVPKNTVLIGSSAAGGVLEQEIKGASFVESFMRAVTEKGLKAMFVNIGSQRDGREGDTINVAFTSNEQELAGIYGSLDLFVMFSKAETCPLVCMEAMSCGVPVAAFSVGALPELIESGESGVLVPPFEVDRLAAEAARFLVNVKLREARQHRVREIAQRRFDVRMMTMAYAKVYAAAVARRAQRTHPGMLRVPKIAMTRQFVSSAGALHCVCEEMPLSESSQRESVLAQAYAVYASACAGSDAAALAEKMLSGNDATSELEYLLGDALRMGAKTAQACAWFLRGYKKDPRDLSMLVGAGRCLLDLGKKDQALFCAEAALKAAPDDARIRALYDRCR
jgi:hypothetical protein